MPTIIKENYLKALYQLDQKSSEISITDLGKLMDVSKPTVNDMVKKLQTKGWVIYEKYKPLKLTKIGKKEAALVVRKHRLSEMFLAQIMGFGWEEVHEIAEDLEHIKSEGLFDRMDELMGFPSTDPHGSPIPDKFGNLHQSNHKVLAQVSDSKIVILKALRDSSSEFLHFLNKYELTLGTQIIIDHTEPFDKSMIVSYGIHQKISLSSSVTNRLMVEIAEIII